MRNKSNILKGVVASLVAVQLVAPALARAEETLPRPPRENPKASFCARINAADMKMDERVYERETKLSASRKEREMRMKDAWNKRDETLAEKRAERNENIESHITKIESRDLTDTQKAALETFKEVHATALAARKSAVDAAISTYRSAVESAATNQKASADALIAAFKSDMEAAYAKAKADCAAGVADETVKATLMADIKAAKDTLMSARQELGKRGDIIKPFVETRNTAFKKAFEDFKTAMEKAKTDLRAAFPKTDR